MEATISSQVIEVLDALCEKFGIAIDWTSKNVLPYAQELVNKYVKYELWTSIFWIILMGAVVGLCWIIYFKTSKAYKINSDLKNTEFIIVPIIFMIVSIFLSVIFIILLFIQVMDIITCLTFPEKIVVEAVRLMMRSE